MEKQTDEKNQKIEGEGEEIKKTGEEGEEGKDEKKEPSYEELKSMMKDLKEKFVPREALDSLKTELEGVKGKATIVERIQKAITGETGDSPADEKRKADFYKLLVNNPTEAIRQVIEEDRKARDSEAREKAVEREFKKFSATFPEYKKYEDDMKAELLANPGWFSRPNFLQRVFFDVLSFKNPKLLGEILESGRAKIENEEGEFVFEGASQTDHGAPETGKVVLDRMKAAGGKTKSFFE